MSVLRHPNFLRAVLFIDVATCVATGALLTGAAEPLAGLTALPEGLLRAAGFSLFPIAGFIALVASRARPPSIGVWLVIAGNIAWILGSVALLAAEGVSPSGFGYGFVIFQAAVVAVLAELELMGLSRSTRPQPA